MIKRILKSNLFKNFSYLTLGEVVSKAIGFFVAIYVARILGPDNFGKLGFAQAFISYFGLIVNLGLDIYGVREVAKDKSRAKELLSNIVSMKFFLFIFAYALLFSVVNFLPKDAYTKKVILLYGLSLFTSVLAIDWFFQGFENFKIIAIGRIIRNVVYASLVFSFIRYQYQLMEFIGIQILSAVVGAAVLWAMSYSFFSFKAVDLAKWKDFGKTGFILASSFFMISIYYNLDKVMIGFWFPDKYVGWYNAAYKIMFIFGTVGNLYMQIIFPKLSKANNDLKRFLSILEKASLKFVSPFVLVGFFYLFVSNKVIYFIFGQEYYLPRVIFVSEILVLTQMGIWFFSIYGFPLVTLNLEKLFLISVSLGGLSNLVGNIIFIPKYDIIGAALSTLFSELVVGGIQVYFFYKYVTKKFWMPHVYLLLVLSFYIVILIMRG